MSMADHPAGGGLVAEVIPMPERQAIGPAGETGYCAVCDDVRIIWGTGRCSACGQMLGTVPGDECTPCSGEGVVGGLVVGDGEARDQTCFACRGTGRVPHS